MRVVRHLPQEAVRVGEVTRVAAVERLGGRPADPPTGGFHLRQDVVHLSLPAREFAAACAVTVPECRSMVAKERRVLG